MRTRRPYLLLLLAAASLPACGEGDVEPRAADTVAVADARTCGVSSGDVQVRGGVGVLRPGLSVSDANARCRVVVDTVVRGAEGAEVRLLAIELGADTAWAEVEGDSVWRIRLTNERFRTAAGFGPGSAARAVAAAPGASVALGEGEVYMQIAERCGESYRVAGVEFARMAAAVRGDSALAALPDSARVDGLLLFRCAPEADA